MTNAAKLLNRWHTGRMLTLIGENNARATDYSGGFFYLRRRTWIDMAGVFLDDAVYRTTIQSYNAKVILSWPGKSQQDSSYAAKGD